MHIGVNGLRLSGQRLGVGRYIEYLLKYWDRQLGPSDRVTVFTRGSVDTRGLPTGGSVTLHGLRPSLTGTAWENLVLPRALRDVDLLFCPSYTTPFIGSTPAVVVTHSVDEVREGTHSWWHNQTRARMYRASARRSKTVIVPSAATRDAVEGLYGIPAERVHVVELGVDVEVFRPLGDDPRTRDAVRRYLGGDHPYVLFVGKMSHRRNIPLLLRAFARFRERGFRHKLLLFGPNHEALPLERLVIDLGLKGEVVQNDGRVEAHRDLAPVYGGADMFVHPTTYDATSLPVLEALACGVPVITTRTGGLAQLCDGAAMLLDRWDVDSLADAMAKVASDSTLRGDLTARGLVRASACSWDVTARRTLEIVRSVAGSSLAPTQETRKGDR